MAFKTEEFDRSPNEIFMKFHSRDIEGKKVGCYSMDIDSVIYTFVGGQRHSVAFFDFKHNGIFGKYKEENPGESIIDLSRDSIKYMIELADREKAAAFIGVTYTKENEQPHQMFFLWPLNGRAKSQLDIFSGKQLRNHWFSPYEMAEFAFKISGKKPLPNGKYKELPNVRKQYLLPKFICDTKKVNCNCLTCKLTEGNNKCLK